MKYLVYHPVEVYRPTPKRWSNRSKMVTSGGTPIRGHTLGEKGCSKREKTSWAMARKWNVLKMAVHVFRKHGFSMLEQNVQNHQNHKKGV